MAALKRAQAQQRKGSPEAQQQPLLAVKVELSQLVLSILDDPSVSRVMKEASFSSAAVKSAIELSLQSQPPPPVASSAEPAALAGAVARRAYVNPRLLQGAAAAPARSGYVNPRLQPQLKDAHHEDEVKRIFEVMAKPSKRNPVLIGDGDGVAAVLKSALQKIAAGEAPAHLHGAKVIELKASGADKAAELSSRIADEHGAAAAVVNLGDFKWLVDGAPPAAVGEIAKLLRRDGGRLWMVATAAGETYFRCNVYHPTMEADWDLQPVSIAAARRPPLLAPAKFSGAAAPRGGALTVPAAPAAAPWRPRAAAAADEPPGKAAPLCAVCSSGYERELAKLVGDQVEKSVSASAALPHWLKLGAEPPKPKQLEMEWQKCTDELQKKWTAACAQLHGGGGGAAGPALAMPKLAPAAQRPQMATTMNPGSPVKTDLVLGRPDKPEMDSGVLSDLQRAKIAGVSDIDTFKRILKGLSEKVGWQSDAASTVAAAVTQCRSGERKKQATRGDIWLLFLGPDRVGKRRMAAALSELLFSAAPVTVSFDSGAGGGLWGKTALDCVTDALRQNPFTVIAVEGVDRADGLVRGKLRRAIERGRMPDSQGREVSLSHAVFVLTADWIPDELIAQESAILAEEKMLKSASSRWRLEVHVAGGGDRKHRPEWPCDDGCRPRKLHKDGGLSLDLSLAVGAAAPDDNNGEGSFNSSEITAENENDMGQLAVKCLTSSAAGDFVGLVDDAVVFRPVDFAPVKKNAVGYISAKVEQLVGGGCEVRIDDEAADRIAGGLWFTGTRVEDWAEKALLPSIAGVVRSKNTTAATVRLSVAADKAAPRILAGETTAIVEGISAAL